MIRLRSALNARLVALREGAERGLTLVELLVAMVIFALLLVLVSSAYSTIARTVTLAGNVNNSIALSSLGMNEISKVLRFAATNPVLNQPIDNPAFVTASPETVSVYSYVDANPTTPAPTQVTFSLDSSRRLIESRYAAYSVATGYWAFKTTPYVTRILTGAVIAPGTGELSLFTYLDANNNAIACGTACTASQINAIASVEVTMKIKGNSGASSKPLFIQNTVGLPNLDVNRTGQN